MSKSAFANGPGTDTARLLSSAATVNATLVRARRVSVISIQGHNARTSAVYLKLYDLAATPAETDTPRKTIYLPASTSFVFDYAAGIEMANGLGYRLTTDNADAGTTAVASGDILALNIDYVK